MPIHRCGTPYVSVRSFRFALQRRFGAQWWDDEDGEIGDHFEVLSGTMGQQSVSVLIEAELGMVGAVGEVLTCHRP